MSKRLPGMQQLNVQVPWDLLARVKARASAENPPGQSFNLPGKVLYFLELYARVGWAEVLRRCAEPAAPPVAAPSAVHSAPARGASVPQASGPQTDPVPSDG